MSVVILSGLWSLVVSTFNDCRRAFGSERTTKFLLCFNVFLYFFPLAPVKKACLSLNKVCTKNGWHRLFLYPVHHFKPRHLVFNMLCLFYEGFWLERHMGGPWFFFLVCVFTVLSGPVYLLLQALGALLSYSQGCVVGFSGLLFSIGLRMRNLCDFITGTRRWSEEEVRLDELRGNRLRRLDEAAN